MKFVSSIAKWQYSKIYKTIEVSLNQFDKCNSENLPNTLSLINILGRLQTQFIYIVFRENRKKISFPFLHDSI